MIKVLYLTSILMLFSCGDSKVKLENQEVAVFQNKEVYNVEVGDTIEIYHTSNSCCLYCQPNNDKLNHLSFVGSKTVVPERMKNCDGCSSTRALLFRAESEGVDTLRDGTISPNQECHDSIEGLSEYIVRVKADR